MINKPIKAIAIILITALFLSGAALSSAEEKGDESIFKYKKELAITDKQETNLRSIIARIQADATYEDIASILAIESELTAIQMTKWRGMQEKYRKSQEKSQAVSPEQKGAGQ